MRLFASVLAGASALAIAAPAPAAEPASTAQLEARLAALEQLTAELKAELAASKAGQARAEADSARVASTVSELSARASTPSDGFTVGGTTIKLNGYIKAVASFSRYSRGDLASGSLGKDFYLPQTIPVGGAREGNDYEAEAKQTRLWLTTATPIGGHMLKGHIEFDFQTSPGTQGSQRTTNGYNLALRRGFLSFDHFLAGQEWTNFQYVAALPESTDYVGPTEGTVFVRQMQLRYAIPLTRALTLTVSAENPDTASITQTAPQLVENDDDRMPDLTARLTLAAAGGELSFAGLARQLAVDDGLVGDRAVAWGVSAAGKLPFGTDKRHDLRFMLTYGHGIGRYVGLNFAPDALFTSTGGDGRLHVVDNLAGFAALRLGWTASLRSTFMLSYQSADYPSMPAIPALANKRAWSAAGNLFWSPVKGFDLGAEYRHGRRTTVGGAAGSLDRFEMAAKYSF